MAKYQELQEKKKRSAEAKKTIEIVGESGKKGRKAFKELADEEVKEKEKAKDFELNVLDSKRGNLVTYHSLLEKLLIKRLNLIEWPAGWHCDVGHTD